MPGFTGTGPAIVTALILVGLIGAIAVFSRDPARRAAALEVLRMLLRIRPSANGNRGQARHRRDRRRNRARRQQGGAESETTSS